MSTVTLPGIRPGEHADVHQMVAFLNDLLLYDRPAVAALIANRVPCNGHLAEGHPTVQCGRQHGGYHVGLLGILNGFYGAFDDGPLKGSGAIAAIFGDPSEGEHDMQLERFVVLDANGRGISRG